MSGQGGEHRGVGHQLGSGVRGEPAWLVPRSGGWVCRAAAPHVDSASFPASTGSCPPPEPRGSHTGHTHPPPDTHPKPRRAGLRPPTLREAGREERNLPETWDEKRRKGGAGRGGEGRGEAGRQASARSSPSRPPAASSAPRGPAGHHSEDRVPAEQRKRTLSSCCPAELTRGPSSLCPERSAVPSWEPSCIDWTPRQPPHPIAHAPSTSCHCPGEQRRDALGWPRDGTLPLHPILRCET